MANIREMVLCSIFLEVLEKPKPRAKPRKKEDPKLIFPAKQVKFEYQRFSRYKLKAESESTLVKASQDFLKDPDTDICDSEDGDW